MAYTLDTKVGEILKDTRAVETLEKYAPGSPKILYLAWQKV